MSSKSNEIIVQLNEDLAKVQVDIGKLNLKWIKASDQEREKILLERGRLDARLNAIVAAIGAARQRIRSGAN